MASIRANCRKVLAIGRNYADHIAELKNVTPKQPFFFLKPPSSILAPNEGPVLRPRGVKLHYEVELGLIMGRSLKYFDGKSEEEALDAIEAYCVAIDMTARNVQDEAKKKGLPWSTAKGFDTFTVVSGVIPKGLIRDPHNVHLHLSINDAVKQSESSNLMIYRIPRILSHISNIMTIEKGDLVLTGTPKGVGSVDVGERMRAGLKFDGKDIREGDIDVKVEENPGLYEFKET